MRTLNTFPVLNFLKRVASEAFFQIAFKTFDILQCSVATHSRCGEIFSDSIITFFSDSDSETIS